MDLDARQWGSLLHAVLEDAFRGMREAGIVPSPGAVEAVQSILDAACDRCFAEAPRRFGFRPGPLWSHKQAEARRQLARVVAWECEEAGRGAGFEPFREEVRFGFPGDGAGLELEDAAGEPYRVHGIIDRVDVGPGRCLRVVDYKSGSTEFSKADIDRGKALQTALYGLAAERLWPDRRVTRSHYLHLPTLKQSGSIDAPESFADHERVQAAVTAAGEAVARARQGAFPAAPVTPTPSARACRDSCEWASLCRVTRRALWKGRRGG
jgi:ATP-dependent helicase/DNAse subunit B